MAWWLMPRTPDPEVGGSSPTRVKLCCVLVQGIFTPQKVLVILRKRWLRPNMTEKLFTGTLRINQSINQSKARFGHLFPYQSSRLSQLLSSRTPDQGVPGSRTGRVAVRCGLEQVTFIPFVGSCGRMADLN